MEIHDIFYSTTYATYIWTLKCAMLQPDMIKTLVLYHSGPLMYVYVCIQIRYFINQER